MKVYQIQPGAGLDGLALDERSEPMPAPGQVLIKVKAVSLNDRDLLILKGLYPGVIEPVIPVSDAEGLVFAPDHLSDEEASCLPCAGVTAWRALTNGVG